jgi:hypothetical protein
LLLNSNPLQGFLARLFLLADSQLTVRIGTACHKRELIGEQESVVFATSHLKEVLLSIEWRDLHSVGTFDGHASNS